MELNCNYALTEVVQGLLQKTETLSVCESLMTEEKKKKRGGAREGAGRPKSPSKPIITSVKFTNQAQKDKYLALGGNTWLKEQIDKA